MGLRPRNPRRVALLAALAVVPVAAGVAVAIVLQGGDGGGSSAGGASVQATKAAQATTEEALPLHPVAGKFEPDETELADCDDAVCYEQAFGNIAYYEGTDVALDLFDEKIAERGPIESGCHRIAHTIGSAALVRNEMNVAKAFAEGRASCWSGYYHGILERAFADVTSFEPAALAGVSQGLCEDPDVRAITWLAYQCVHGLGHGLMIHTGYDLPLSLEVCNGLATGWDQTSCKGGVFMENISTSYGVQSRFVKDEDPVYPCNWVAENDKLYCYLMVTSRVLRVYDWDWERTAKTCAGVEPNWVDTCFQSFGRDASGSSRQDPHEILELCGIAREYGGEGDCISAAAKDMTANYASGVQATELCNAAAQTLRGWCYYAIGTIQGTFKATEAEKEADCRALTDVKKLAAQCVRGAMGLAAPQTVN